MTFIFKTKNINKSTYEKIARRYIWLQFGSETWEIFNKKFDVIVAPVEESDMYRQMYSLTTSATSPSIAWGFTQIPNIISNVEQKGRVFWFVNDTKNPFIIRSNAEKGCHEFAHAGTWIIFGNERRTRLFDDVSNAKAGSTGATYVTLVHDVAYGFKKMFTFWVRWGVMWIPIKGIALRDYVT